MRIVKVNGAAADSLGTVGLEALSKTLDGLVLVKDKGCEYHKGELWFRGRLYLRREGPVLGDAK